VRVAPDSIEAALAKLLTLAGSLEATIKCLACGQKNRVTSKHVDQAGKPRRGKCGLPLPWEAAK